MQKKSWIDYSKKDRVYHMDAARALYSGDLIDIPVKPRTKRKVKRKTISYERTIQCEIVDYIRSMGLLVHSIPNHGKRSVIGGYIEKRMGLMPGASDLFLAEPNHRYHGFYIEIKSPGNEPTDAQFEFGVQVKSRGYHWDWFDNVETAKLAIQKYLRGEIG